MYSTAVKKEVVVLQEVSVNHRFTLHDIVKLSGGAEGPELITEIVITDHGTISYAMRRIGSTFTCRRGAEFVDRSYNLWLDHEDYESLVSDSAKAANG